MNSQQLNYSWRSKDLLKQHLTHLVRELGAATYPVPRSDCLEVIRDDVSILVAIKESRQQKMWVDARLFTDLMLDPSRTYKQGFILLIDHWAERLLVLESTKVLAPILIRDKYRRAWHESVRVDRVSSGSGYEVSVLPGTTGIPVEHINTLEPVLAILRFDSSACT